MSSALSTNGGCCVIRDRFQIFLCLLLFLHKARTTFSDQAVFPVLALSMDMFALFGMYAMHKTNKRLSGSSLAITIVVNTLKYVSLEEQDILYLAVALGALTLLWLHYQSSLAVIVPCLPAMLAYFGHLPSPFAVAYLFEAAVGLPLLFATLPNQFGRRRQIDSLPSHVLALIVLGRAFQVRFYLDIGLLRLFEGPWDVPVVFRANDWFAIVARSAGFFLHLLQAGFFVKFALYYIPAFFSASDFQMQRVGCSLQTSLVAQNLATAAPTLRKHL